jgi:NDP-sugar pyrophosphorylase family protein
MKAMILAAGYGTRLRPLTYFVPKPMVPICNRPLIGYAVENFIKAGVRDIVVNLHHLPRAIERFLLDAYGAQCRFHFSFEPEILGTGGGIRKVRALLESEEEFYLVNGDTVQLPPFEALREARRSSDALAALTLRHPPHGDRFTPVWYQGGRVTGFGSGTGEALMFSGSHLISRRIFEYLPDKDFSGIVSEVYVPLIEQGKEVVAAVIDEGPWFDIGTPRRYISAARAVLEMTANGDLPVAVGSRIARDSVVDQRATIHGKVEHSSVGSRSFIKGEVRNSIVGADCRIGGDVVLDSCIVGDDVEMMRPMELRNAMICRDEDVIQHDPTYRYENGIVIAAF